MTTTLLYRRAWRALAVTKGWTLDAHDGPVEIEIARDELVVPVESVGVLEIPALSAWSLTALTAALALLALATLRRRRSG